MTRNTRSKAAGFSAAQIANLKNDEQKDMVFALSAPGSKVSEIKNNDEIKVADKQSDAFIQQSDINLKESNETAAEPLSPRVSSNKCVRVIEEQRMKLVDSSTGIATSDDAVPNSSKVATNPTALSKNLEVSDSFVGSETVFPPLVTAVKQIDNGKGGNLVSTAEQPVVQIPQTVAPVTEGPVLHTAVSSPLSPWLEAVKNNRKIDYMGKLQERFEGVTNECITLTWDDVYSEEEEEARCLIGLFNGAFPCKDNVQNMVDKWPRSCRYHFNNSGWIVFKFDSNEDVLDVLHSGRFYAGNKRMIAKQMPRFFNFTKDDYSVVPVWVQLPNLPTSCWKQESVEKICTYMGKPLYVDKLTKDRETVSFSRCCVEVDLNENLHDVLVVKLPDGSILNQVVFYEDKPSWCKKCKKVGHIEEECYASSTPGLSIYVSRSRLEATNKKNNWNNEKGNNSSWNRRNRSNSKKRGWHRGPSRNADFRPVNNGAKSGDTVGQNLKPVEHNKGAENDGAAAVELLGNAASTKNKNVAETGGAAAGNDLGNAGTSNNPIPLSNKFDAFGSWALESEREEERLGQIRGEKQSSVFDPCKQAEANFRAVLQIDQQPVVQQIAHQTAVSRIKPRSSSNII